MPRQKVEYPRMMKRAFFVLAAALPALATELPPAIPDSPIEYTDVTYDTGYSDYDVYAGDAYAPAAAPIAAASSDRRGWVNVNAYTSDYSVRGMGVRNALCKMGYSSVDASYTLPNRNLLSMGLHQRISGAYGIVWDKTSDLSSPRMGRLSYAVGKEIFPNLVAELGYTYRHGGLEGYMARHYDGVSHHSTHEFNLTLAYNDYQKGFFGKLETGLGFYGLTGLYFDVEAGYRFTDVFTRGNIGADVELSLGVAPSCGYWGDDVEGVDAWRIKAALLPYSHTGRFGRDARFYVKPWVQCSWSGSNAAKIDRVADGNGPIDHFLITVGLDCGFNF